MLDGAKILKETWGDNTLTTLWDNEENICGIRYNDATYFFLKNLQGDIIAIADTNGDVVARYSYDAWGVPTIVSDTSGVNIATVNPFRYRGYYYDSETQLYYLQSRYYNPTIGRFVNADEAENIVFIGPKFRASLFAYVNNNPISNSDEDGYFSLNVLFDLLNDICSKMIDKLKTSFTSLLKFKNGQIYISTAVISATIDLIIALIISKWVEGTIRRILKFVVNIYFAKGGQKGILIAKKILNWFAKGCGKFIGSVIIKVMVGLAIGAMGLETPVKSVMNSIVENCLSSILSFESKLFQRISSLVSAFSSIGGLIAFLLDISDFQWDDYWSPGAILMSLYVPTAKLPSVS